MNSRSVVRALFAVLSTAVMGSGLTGCESPPPGAAGAVARDSADVRIVEYASVDPADTLHLGTEPLLEIGLIDGTPEYVLHSVTDVLTVNGGIVVSTGPQIRWFDASGRFLRQAGARGDGPGEFRSTIYGLAVVPPDTILAYESNRAHVFRPDGTHVRSFRFDNMPYALRYLDSRRWATFLRVKEPGPTEVSVFTEDREVILVDDAGANADTVARVRGGRLYGTGNRSLRVPDSPQALMAANGNRIAVADGGIYEITLLDIQGRAHTVIRNAVPPPVPVIPEPRQERSLQLEGPASQADLTPPNPEHGPALHRLLLSEDGNLWVLRGVQDSVQEWHVYAADSNLDSVVRVPVAFEITEIRADTLIGIWQDELDVPFVRVYTLREEPADS